MSQDKMLQEANKAKQTNQLINRWVVIFSVLLCVMQQMTDTNQFFFLLFLQDFFMQW